MEKINDREAEVVTTAAENLENLAQKTGSYISSKADQLTGKIGGQIRSMAEILRARSPHETVRETTYKIAAKLDSAGSYLEENDLKTILNSVGSVARRYPLRLILMGVGVGFFVVRRRGK